MSEISKLVLIANESYASGAYERCLENLEKLNALNVESAALVSNNLITNFARSLWFGVDDYSNGLSALNSKDSHSAGYEYFVYNQAVLAFHSGYFVKASELLCKILEFSSVKDAVVVNSSLLLAEVYLLLKQPEKIVKVLLRCDNFLNEKDKASPNKSDAKSSLIDFTKSRTCFAKCRASMINRNYKLYQKEVKRLSPQSWTSMLIRAQFEYQRLSPQKALKTLMNLKDQMLSRDSLATCGVSCLTLQLNAMGCTYFQLNKLNLSLLLFQKAIAEYTDAFNLLPRNSEGQLMVPLFCRNSVNRLYLLQNIGVALLHTKQPTAAFDCLIEVVKVVNNSCRLWLRLAECCIMVHRPNNEIDFEMQKRKRSIVKEIVGVGPHRKIILNTCLHGKKQNLNNEQGAMPTLSLEFAHFCLKNALATLPSLDVETVNSFSEATPTDTQSSAAAPETSQMFQTSFSNPLSVKEIYRLKCSVLCVTSYVCLCLGENQLALEAAKNLLTQIYASPTHKLLACLYAAEASVLCDRFADALNFLSITLPNDKNLILPELWNGRDPTANGWFPDCAASFKTILYYNMAVVCTLQEEFERAAQVIASIGEAELPIQVTMLGLYIQIHLGQHDAARYAILKTFPQLQSPMSFN